MALQAGYRLVTEANAMRIAIPPQVEAGGARHVTYPTPSSGHYLVSA